MRLRVLVILLTFFIMGFGDARGSFVGIAKETFGISAAQGSLIPFCGALAFGLFGLPAGMVAARRGQKALLLAGLAITALGHALPWLWLPDYRALLAAVFLIGVGMTCLLVSGNPLLREVTRPERYARNLTFAQFIKSLGSMAGPYLIAALVALGFSWKELFPVFGLCALAALVAVTGVRMPEAPRYAPASLKASLRLLQVPAIRLRVLGIFLFVGSEMGMNTWLATHMWRTHGLAVQVDAIRYGQGLFWIAQAVGRVLGSVLLTWMDPRRFFLGCALLGLAGLLGLMLGDRAVAIASVVVCGASFANVWPTLFAFLLESRPHRAAEISGLTVMANSGGAVVPGLMGLVMDLGAVRWGFLVPLAAFVYLVLLGLFGPAVRARS